MTRPFCFASPTTFNPESLACRGCPVFGECGAASLQRVRSLGKVVPLVDLENLLEAGLKRRGIAFPPAPGSLTPPTPAELVATSIDPPARAFERVKRKTLLLDEMAWLESLPVKVAKILRPMIKTGLLREIGPALAQGRNPFPVTPNPYLREALDVLLHDTRVSKAALRHRYQECYQWSEGTAFSHVAVASRIFMALDIVEDIDNCLVLRQEPVTIVGEC